MITGPVTSIIERARVILLDFDGPICSVFANHPAPMVAAELLTVLTDQGIDLPAEMRSEQDPLEVLRYAGC